MKRKEENSLKTERNLLKMENRWASTKIQVSLVKFHLHETITVYICLIWRVWLTHLSVQGVWYIIDQIENKVSAPVTTLQPPGYMQGVQICKVPVMEESGHASKIMKF